jgi:hypothetical protein
VRYLAKRGIVVTADPSELDDAEMTCRRITEIMIKNEKQSKNNENDPELRELEARLKRLGGIQRAQAIRRVGSVIREQNATGRVLRLLTRLEKKHGIDFSKVKLTPRAEHRYEGTEHFTMFPWFDKSAFAASLQIGLASHQADVPLYAVCKRLLGDLCTMEEHEELKGLSRPSMSTFNKEGE